MQELLDYKIIFNARAAKFDFMKFKWSSACQQAIFLRGREFILRANLNVVCGLQ